MNNPLRVFFIFLRKDFLIAFSYKLNFFTSIIITFFFLFILKNVSRLSGNFEALGPYANDSFAFFFLGFALINLMMTISARGVAELRNNQLSGTLEELFISGQSPLSIFLSMFSYPIINAYIRMVVFYFIAKLFFGLEIFINIDALLVSTFFLTLFSIGLGLFSAAIILIFKRGDFINMLNLYLCVGFGGVLFPSEIIGLPNDLHELLPLYNALEIVRSSSLATDSFSFFSQNMLYLTLISILILFFGILLLILSFYHVKKRGTLGNY